MKTLYTPARMFTLALLVVLAGASFSRAQAQFSYTDFSSTAGLQLNGSAAAVNNGSVNVLRVAPANFFQDGSVYYATPLSLSSAFTTQFTFQFPQVSPNGLGPADGISFIIQNSPATDAALGFFGGGIGYGADDLGLFPRKGIPNSLAIEIDTYRDAWDPPTPHMAVMSCLTGYNSSHHGGKCANGTKAGSDPTIAINSALPTNVLDGKTHKVIVKYQLPCPGCQNLTVQLDGQQVLAVSFDLATLGLDANDNAYIGFTAATGGGFEDHDILSWSFYPDTIVVPVSPSAPTTFSFAPTLTHTIDFSQAGITGNLTYPNGDPATLQIQSTNNSVDPATWPQYVTGGPLATSILFPLVDDNPGGVGPNGALFVDLCFDPTMTGNAAIPLDSNCPYATNASGRLLGIQIAANVNSKPPINTGFTTALAHYEPHTTNTTTWAPSTINGTPNPACSITTGPDHNDLAPQKCDVLDIQQSIYGDPTQNGKTKNKGDFAMIYNVPMPLSSVSINGTPVNAPSIYNPGFSSALWFNTPLRLNFMVNPACPLPQPTLTCTFSNASYNYFTPAPIAGETYQVTDLQGNVVYPLPANTAPAQAIPESDFDTLHVQPITFPDSSNEILSLADGQYYLQWSAVDNVGISEQNVQLINPPGGPCVNPNPPGGTTSAPCYQTTLFQAALNVDSTLPTISVAFSSALPPTVTPIVGPFTVGQTVYPIYTCSDNLSGIANCGGLIVPPVGGVCPTSPSPSTTSTALITSSPGSINYPQGTATDCAGNVSAPLAPFTVNPAALTITANNAAMTYGAAALPALSATGSGFVNKDTLASLTTQPTCTTLATSTSIVGAYFINCSGAVDANYTITYVAGTLTVNPAAPLTITANNAAMTYGAAALPALSATGSGFVNNDTLASLPTQPTCTTSATNISKAGAYSITCSGAVDANYSTINYVGGTLTVNPVPLTITASSAAVAYGAAIATITPSYSGFVNGDSASNLTPQPTCSTTATSLSNVGNYLTTCSGAADANYTISYVNGLVTVGAAPVIVTASSGAMNYGGTPPVITPSYSGLRNGHNPTTSPICSTTANSSSPLGSYPSSCSGAADADYTFSYVAGSVAVNPVPLIITASSANVVYGGAIPAITSSYSGFVNGDSAASLTKQPTCSTTANSTIPGIYPSSCTGAVDANYTISYVNGTVSVISPLATVSPLSIDFGSVKTGTTAFKSVTLTNSGNALMTITSIKIVAASDSDEFSSSSNCGGTLAASNYCTITVGYHADRDDTNGATGTLAIYDNAPGSPQTVPLKGKKL